MEKPINFYFVRSLYQIALSKLTAMLWNQRDIRNSLTEVFSYVDLDDDYDDDVLGHSVIIREKVRGLTLPEDVQEEIFHLIQPIGSQLYAWVQNHTATFFPDLCLPNEFSWTSVGNIDEKETAKMLVEDESLNSVTRYKLACTYCLENDIAKLWNELPEDYRNKPQGVKDIFHEPLVALWTYEMGGPVTEYDLKEMIKAKGYEDDLHSFPFQYAACTFNKPATEFFFQKLSDNECIARTAVKAVILCCEKIDVLCFLMSQMSLNQQLDIFKEHSDSLLCCFLRRPYINFFFKIIDPLWSYVSEKDFCHLLKRIAILICDCGSSFYVNLFVQIWHMGSTVHKKYALTEGMDAFCFLLCYRRLEYNRVIFKELTSSEKKDLIFSPNILNTFEYLIRNNWPDRLDFFIRECLTSAEVAKEFRSHAEMCVVERGIGLYSHRTEFFRILDDFISELVEDKGDEMHKTTEKHQTCSM